VHHHPALAEALISVRFDELRRSDWATAQLRREKRWHGLVAAARRGTGWLLVDMGLRLAVPRADTTRRVARGAVMVPLGRSRSA
jgi:hypothetical protein